MLEVLLLPVHGNGVKQDHRGSLGVDVREEHVGDYLFVLVECVLALLNFYLSSNDDNLVNLFELADLGDAHS